MSTQVTIENSLIYHNAPSENKAFRIESVRMPFILRHVTFSNLQESGLFPTVGTNGLVILNNVSNVSFNDCTFLSNVGNMVIYGQGGSVVLLVNSKHINFTNCEFRNNTGSPISSMNSNFTLSGSNTFSNNRGYAGGAMTFYGSSYVTLANGSDVRFVNNSAEVVGGVIFVDYGINTHCFYTLHGDYACENTATPVMGISLTFDNNKAQNGGDKVYGASFDTCKVGGAHSTLKSQHCRGWNFATSLFHVKQRNDSDFSAITSSPSRACLCDTTGRPSCTTLFKNLTHYPGESFRISAVVVGDRFGTVDGSVYAQLLPVNGTGKVGYLESTQCSQRLEHLKCTILTYAILSNSTSVMLVLTSSSEQVQPYPQKNEINDIEAAISTYNYSGEISSHLRSFPVYINISLLPCPLGFVLSGEQPRCNCDPKLQSNHISCSIATQTVQRSGTEWVNASFHNNSYDGVILNKYCPNDYCNPEEVNVNLKHPDTQCAFNHSGVLCGGCQSGLSLALGSAQCLQCSNAYLALLIPFALAGFALVFFITLLNLTVAKGTLNGLIFYANIVRANQVAWIPAHHTNILTVFIAWINLDLGIETCLVHGLNAYWKTWLQFIFPLYIWTIVIMIITLSRYSSSAAKIFSSNSVPVLATLFLLSYSKLLSIIISIFQASFLDYPEGTSATVWSYDGNIPYFSPKRIPLLLVALMVLLFLWLPYTGVLLFAQCLQRSNYRIATLLMIKFKPFLDAYFGPLKDSHRYWIGLLLLVRGALFVVYAATPTSMAGVDLLATAVAMLCLLVYPPFGYVYRKTYLNLLKNSFLLNLGVLAVGTLYIQGSGGQAALAYTSIGIAFALFVAVVIFHALASLRATRLINANHYFNIQDPQQAYQDRGDYERIPEEQEANRAEVSRQRVTFNEYREPVLRYLDDQ